MPLPIECDTDGIYFQWDESLLVAKLETDVNNHVKEEVARWGVDLKVKREWGIEPKVEVEMEANVYPVGYWYKSKTYTLLQSCDTCKGEGCISCDQTGQQLKITGGSFKSTKTCPMFDQVRDKFAKLRLSQNVTRSNITTAITKAMNIDQYSIKDLTMGLQLSKSIDDYDGSFWGIKIARRAERLLNVKPQQFYRYEFIYADNEDNIEMSQIATMKDVDHRKYREVIAGIAERFGWGKFAWSYVKVPPLFEVGEVTGW